MAARASSYLVEVLGGMRTVKSQNFEVEARWRWLEHYRRLTGARFRLSQLSTLVQEGGQLVQRLQMLAVIVVGALLVLNQQITMGALFAVYMLSSQVVGPLLRLSGLWQGFQELQVSLDCLSDVMSALPEAGVNDQQLPPLPPIAGGVRLEGVSFSYGARGPRLLDGLDLTIQPGQFVGLVGLSGSGKSTLVQLIDRLYTPRRETSSSMKTMWRRCSWPACGPGWATCPRTACCLRAACSRTSGSTIPMPILRR